MTKFVVIMHGTSGKFRTPCATLDEAEKLRKNINYLGYYAEVKEVKS